MHITFKLKTFALLLCNLLIFCNLLTAAEDELPHVLVSVAPHKFFVEKIAGGTVAIDLMVPAGSSAHTYEPTPKQILRASGADLWFCVGESFEARAIKALTSHNPNLKTIDMREGVDMIKADPQSGACCCCHASGYDLHIWLSAKEAKIQARTIAKALMCKYPQHTPSYERALQTFIDELDELDKSIAKGLASLKNRYVMVSHPAYAYYCRDYHLKQLSIEFEGKDPTPYQLTILLNKARQIGVKRVYIQPQYSSKGAKLFAKELNADLITLDPYKENFMESMHQITQAFEKN